MSQKEDSSFYYISVLRGTRYWDASSTYRVVDMGDGRFGLVDETTWTMRIRGRTAEGLRHYIKTHGLYRRST